MCLGGAGVGDSTFYNEIYSQTFDGCFGDHLQISDGSSTQTYCGTSTPAPLTTTTITVKLHLVGGGGTGFLATACCSVAVTTDVSTGEWRVSG